MVVKIIFGMFAYIEGGTYGWLEIWSTCMAVANGGNIRFRLNIYVLV